MKHFFYSIFLVFGLSPLPAAAIDANTDIQGVLKNELSAWVNTPLVINALRAQNSRNEGLTAAEVVALDDKWRAEVGSSETPFQAEIMARDISTYLISKQAQSAGIVSEVFVMDNHGLNVGQSGLTSDYWQGDEAKFQKTFSIGSGAVHTSEVELDESTGAYLVQISTTISDPDTGSPLGAVTFGINVGMLE